MRDSMASNAAPEAPSDINLTPMLDVVFILLIFFLVVASFVKEDGLDLSASDPSLELRVADENILVSIREDNVIWIGDRMIDPRAIRANLARLAAENPAATVVIQADRRSANKALVQTMDASRQAGINRISLAARQR